MCENWGEFTTIVAATWGANTTGENERSEHFLWNVYLGAQGYVPSAAQMQPQSDALNTASAQGEEAVITKAKELARAQIESSAYTARNRTDSEYVTDLYEAFWQRSPDGSELSRWMSKVTSQGRASVLTSFADSTAFREVAGTLYRETLWLIPDQLGTPRIIAERTGTLAGIKRHDYLPFGEEVKSGVAGRTDGQGYVSDSVREQFTSKERDDETGLDFFGARYYASAQGRFTSIDPILVKASRLFDPQRINLYIYGRNNPSKYKDPDGKDIVLGTQDKSEQKILTQALVEIAKTASGREFLTKLDKMNVVFSLTVGKAEDKSGNENYGRTRIDQDQAKQILGKGEQAKGTISIMINPSLIKNDTKENSKIEEVNKGAEANGMKPKALPYPDVPQGKSDETRNAEALGHELTHGEKDVEIGSGGSEDAATDAAREMLNDPNKAENPKKFIEELIQPKKQL